MGVEPATLKQRQAIARHLIAALRQEIVPAPACYATQKTRMILFAPPLVRAILDGRKTITRRLIVPQPSDAPPARCPLGMPKDRLRVREKWGYRCQFYNRNAKSSGPYVYAADGPPTGAKFLPWKPSLHMPSLASRLMLEIASVRAERLTQISRQDALAEGCPAERRHDPIEWFRGVWDHFHASHPWDADPWVWVIAFRPSAKMQPGEAEIAELGRRNPLIFVV